MLIGVRIRRRDHHVVDNKKQQDSRVTAESLPSVDAGGALLWRKRRKRRSVQWCGVVFVNCFGVVTLRG
jgi:hypothetical protein